MPSERQEITAQQYERIKATLGADAEMFKRTKLGQYIMDRCAVEVDKAFQALKSTPAEDTEKIRHWQNEIWKHETFELWLDEAINSGHGAMQNLKQMETVTEDENNYMPPPQEGGDLTEPPEMPGE